jgi:O-antigen/teichoic acid export membrane protein
MAMILTIFLPRKLGAEGIGILHLAESLWVIVALFIAFGMDTYLTKEVARFPDKTSELLWSSISLRGFLFIFTFVGVVIYANAAGYAELTVTVLLIYGFGRLISEFGNAVSAVLVGLERMEYMALANVALKAFSTVVTILVLILGYDVVAVAVVFIGSSVVGFLIQLFYLSRLQFVRPSFGLSIARKMLKASLPYVFITVFSVLYMNLDAIFISLIVNEETLGWYSGADRLFGTMMFIPSVFITAAFPALARLNVESPEELKKLMRRSFDMLLLLGVPIGLGLIAVADNLVVFLYGQDFVNSGPVLAIMGLVLIFTYQNILLGRFMIAVDRQNVWTIVMAVATAATIVLDIFLIPLMHNVFGNGAIGGALSFVVTEILMTLVGLRYLPDGALTRKNAWTAVKIGLAGLMMTAAVWPLRHLFIALPVAAGGIVYLLAILLLRAMAEEDKLLVKDMGLRIWYRTLGRRSQPVGMDG